MSTPPDDTRLLASRLQALSPARRAAVERLLRERRNAWRVTAGLGAGRSSPSLLRPTAVVVHGAAGSRKSGLQYD